MRRVFYFFFFFFTICLCEMLSRMDFLVDFSKSKWQELLVLVIFLRYNISIHKEFLFDYSYLILIQN